MNQPDLEQLCKTTRALVEEVGDFIRGEIGRVAQHHIVEKDLNSLVSYVDETAEKQLVAGLRRALPGSVFLTEEATVTPREGRYRWIIDPLDGTTNFLFHVPHFAVSVGLEADGRLVLGVVLEVNHRECFYAWSGGGAYLNGEPISCRDTAELSNALLATGFPYRRYEEMPQYLEVFDYFMRHTRGLRRFGAAALDLAWVACGRFDGFFEKGLHAWDVAGGAVIVREAGGMVTDFSGEQDYLHTGELVAASAALHPAMLAPVKKAFER